MFMTETILGTPLPIVRRRLKNRAPVLRLHGPSFNKVLTRAGRATEHVAAACVAILLFATSSVQAAERQALRGHVPRAIADLNLQPVGLLPGTNRLHLAIGLPLRNQEALTALLQQLYDPASPNYRHYLTPEQFTEKFGPTEQDYQAVVAFAKANGFAVTATYPNRVVLDVEGTVADIERTLHVTMRVYQHPTEARMFYVPDVEPSLDLAVPILHINGLDNYALPFPKLVRKPASKVAVAMPNAGSGPSGSYLGYDFRKAYIPGTTLTGTGQSVALFELDGYYAVDISNYVALAGLPNVPLVNVPVNGGIGTPGVNGGIDEVSLDIEMVVAMAPGLSHVYVYEGLDPDSVLSKIASDNLAQQISSSWGWSPGPDLVADGIFAEMATQGQTFFDAVGDYDAFAPGTADTYAPSTSTNITEVGGTTLMTSGPGGVWTNETVWNWRTANPTMGEWGGSGGISTNYSIPVYQKGIIMSVNGGSTTKRNVPDVALTADNVYVIANKGADNGIYGGTSCAAPLWAGFTALINQQGAANSVPPVGFLNPAIYAIGPSGSYTNCFHDITTGNNTWGGSTNQFYAVSGYDLCTGWGTPNGTNLINALLGAPLVPPYPSLVSVGSIVSGGNGNGVIDYDECNLLYLPVANVGYGTATVVNATLTTSTPGVTITQPTSTYSNLAPGAITTNNTPFQISTSLSFVCGTPIPLSLALSYTGGSNTNTITLPTCQCPTIQVNGSLSASSPTQSGSLWPSGTNSTCSAAKSCPGTYAAGTVAYHAYSYTNSNSSAVCVSVTVSATCGDDYYSSIFSEAYLGNYNPGSLCTHYLADMGGNDGQYSGPGVFSYSFTVPANTNFTVVVNGMHHGYYCSSYTLTVAGLLCPLDGGGACAGVSANFSGTPTNGVAPLAVTFTDTSTGTITNRFWDFGDSTTTNTTATNVQHTYNAAGTNTVTLIVSGPLGDSTNTRPNYVTVLTTYQGWQMQYFGCIGCLQAAETADPDGDGQNNLAEFLAGTDPTNSASAFHIISIVQEDDDLRVGWLAGGGRTNVVQAVNDAGSGFTNSFSDLSPLFIIPGAGDVLTNYLDVGGATNAPSRFYRVRLVP
jgi:subtilase family serine protease